MIHLDVLTEEATDCTACELHKTPGKVVMHRGKTANVDIACIGEAPGATEAEQGIPFCGRSGKLLDKMIEAMGYKSDDVFVANVCKHRPPDNRKPTPEEMKACIHFLEKQLEFVKPKVIITFGATATEGLLGPGPGITKRRGKWGYWNAQLVLPTLHPSYCLRNPAAKNDVWEDLQLVMKYLKLNR